MFYANDKIHLDNTFRCSKVIHRKVNFIFIEYEFEFG